MVGISWNSCQCHVPEKLRYISIFKIFFFICRPKNFDSTQTASIEPKDEDDEEERSSSSSQDDDSDLFVNTNRPTCEYESSDESSSDEDKWKTMKHAFMN